MMASSPYDPLAKGINKRIARTVDSSRLSALKGFIMHDKLVITKKRKKELYTDREDVYLTGLKAHQIGTLISFYTLHLK
jgi:hypothetical protein